MSVPLEQLDVSVMQLQPGDIVLVSCPVILSCEQRTRLLQYLERFKDRGASDVLLMEAGLDLKVCRPDQLPEGACDERD